ncbi:MAG TPA: 30S ribosome-binding factor RbfA [Acidimicrobiia bacterium]|nr:30S ribosome-binding factor RbfA [Acidimicrobiia bacterium]
MTRPARRYPRTARVNEVMLEVLAEELERMSDPRLELVTLTGIDVTNDLQHATVYFSTLRGADTPVAPVGDPSGQAGAALGAATPRFRSVLSRSVRTRHIPQLEFVVDPAIVHGQRIEEILRSLPPDSPADPDATDSAESPEATP